MNTRTQLVCAWCGPAALALLIIGFWFVAGLIPPPPANDSAQEVAALYRDDTDLIRLGLLITFLAMGLWGPLVAVITTQMRRIEGPSAVLAWLQLAAGAAAWLFLLVPLLVMTAAAFDPGRPPEVTKAIHEIGWILLIMPVTPFVVQLVSLGVAVLQDRRSETVFPRWVGYFNFWAAFLFLPGGLITFFKTGPFAWQGLLAFWVPLTVFGIWLVVMPVMLRRAIHQQARGEAREPAEREAVPA